jgi:hypothetical protein
MFKGHTSHDFGTVPHGAQLYHRFPMTNIWAVPLEIVNVRVSCGCVRATPSATTLKPRESGYLDVYMDARRFGNAKTVSIYVTVGPQFTSTATLQVSANSRMDVVFNPGEINFGVVARGATPSQTVEVEYAGNADWKVVDVATNGAPIEVEKEEWYRQQGRGVGYRIKTTLKADAPPGLLKQELMLITNDLSSPRVPLLVEATVKAALTISPSTMNFGKVKPGDKLSKRVMVKASQPFTVTGIEGLTDGIDIDWPPRPAKTQYLVIKFQPVQPGDLLRQIRVKTDIPDQPEALLTLEAKVEP